MPATETVIGPSKRENAGIFAPFSSVKVRSRKSRAIWAFEPTGALGAAVENVFIGGSEMSGVASRVVSAVPHAANDRQRIRAPRPLTEVART